MKLTFIGIDGASWEVINSLDLPNFKKLINEGTTASLKSLPGYKSPAIWNSIITGRTPEESGISYFTNLFLNKKDISSNFLIDWPNRLSNKFNSRFLKKAYIYSMLKYGNLFEKLGIGGNYLTTSSFRKCKTVWEILSENNVKCGVTGFLTTWPVKPINEYIISEKVIETTKAYYKNKKSISNGEEFYPISLSNLIDKKKESVFNSSLSSIPSFFNSFNDEDKEKIKNKELIKNERINFFAQAYRSDLFVSEISSEFNVEFNALYLSGLDAIQHIFWQYHKPEDFKFADLSLLDKYKDIISKYYKFLDEQIGKFIKEGHTLVIVSDHGISSIKEKDYNDKSIRSGEHEDSPDGIFIAFGKGIKKDHRIDAHVLDVTPTILQIMKNPIDNNMSGKVLDLFENSFTIVKKDYEKIQNKDKQFYSKDEEEDVKLRLKELGYLD